MKTEVKLITPAIAEDLLKRNSMNRPLRDGILNDYARQMSVGLWKEETGEAIKISSDDNILDGQHRLHALIKSNTSLHFLLITDLENEVFTVLDTGVSRTAGDIFHIAGIENANKCAATIVRYLALKRGSTAVLRESPSQSTGAVKLKVLKYSKAELLSVYNGRVKFWKAVVQMSSLWYTRISRALTNSEIGALYAYLFDIDENDAFTFIDSLCNGAELDIKNPIKLLRDKLIFAKTNLKFKLASVQKLGLTFKAWNHFREGNLISVLRFSRELDKFPIPK